MRARARELKDKADGESAVRAAIAAMSPQDRAIAKRFHELVKATHRPRPLAEDLVRDAGVCQGRQDRLLLPQRGEKSGVARVDELVQRLPLDA